jgi:hypothetical protein
MPTAAAVLVAGMILAGLGLSQGAGAAAGSAPRSCGSVSLEEGVVTYDLKIVKGSVSCSTARRVLKFGRPISKNPKFYCSPAGYECEYFIYPEGWRCGGSIQGHFQCWNGASSPARASEIFEGSDEIEMRPRAYLRMLSVRRPACSKHALTKALRRGGLPGQTDAFGCARHFAWAGAVVHHDGEGDEITALFKAGHGSWHPVSRGGFCEDGAVPKKIYQHGCESN